MKKIIHFITIITYLLLLVSCTKDNSVGPSQINTDTPKLSTLDNWLREQFVKPYNIEIQYKWKESEVDLNRFLYPPTIENVKPILEIVLAIWIKPYTQLGGKNFIKNIAPRQFTLVGGYNFNTDGTITLGVAEAGTKITLFNVDQLDTSNLNQIRRYFKTIQHEYAHILNQTKPFDPAYGEINPENYTAQWYNRSDAQALEMGYITAYASSSENEDFAEMVAEMLTHSRIEYDAIVNGITNPTAQTHLRAKEEMVANYFNAEFGIDIYELQEIAHQNTLDIIN